MNNQITEILNNVRSVDKYNLDNESNNNLKYFYQIHAMIEAWESGIIILKNETTNDRIETDYDSKWWYIYQFTGDNQKNNQLNTDQDVIKIDNVDHIQLINMIKTYIDSDFIPVKILNSEVYNYHINSLNEWDHENFPLFV